MGEQSGDPWFRSHYYGAAKEIVDFLRDDGIDLEGARIADIGTGDGLIALGTAVLTNPRELVGFDLENLPDLTELQAVLSNNGIITNVPSQLRFAKSSPTHVPAEDDSFDVAISWSTFQYVSNPTIMCKEIHRILVPGGTALLQIYPFFSSEFGDNSQGPSGFTHLITGETKGPEGVQFNRISIDGLQLALREAGLTISRVELIHRPFQVPPELREWPVSALSIGGVKLTARSLEKA